MKKTPEPKKVLPKKGMPQPSPHDHAAIANMHARKTKRLMKKVVGSLGVPGVNSGGENRDKAFRKGGNVKRAKHK